MRYDLPFTDHLEDVDWCLCTAEELAISWANYAEAPSSEKWVVLDKLTERFRKNFKPPMSVQIEGEDG